MLSSVISAHAEETPEFSYGGFLGVKINDLSSSKARNLGFENQYGAYLSYVYPSSPASEAGLRIFDYIIEVEKKVLKKSFRLSDALSDFEPGDQIQIAYLRNGLVKETKVRLRRRSEVADPPAIPKEKEAFLGVKESSYYDYDRNKGVRVIVLKGYTAYDMGLKNDDIIYSINGFRMIDWDDISTVMDAQRVGDEIRLVYYRGKEKRVSEGIFKSSANRGDSTPNVVSPVSSRRVFLGINGGRMSSTKAKNMGIDNPYGFYITSVVTESVADRYGLQAMDYLYGVDSYRVGADQSLGNILSRFEVEQEADLHLIRQGKAIVVPVRMDSRNTSLVSRDKRNACERPFLGVRKADNKIAFGLDVTIVEGGPAEQIGLKDYDAITRINGHYIIDWNDLSYLHSLYSPGDNMRIEVFRNGNKRTFNSVFVSYKEAKQCVDCFCGSMNNERKNISIDLGDLEQELEALSEELKNLDIDINIDFGDSNEYDKVTKRNNRSVEVAESLDDIEQKKVRSYLNSSAASGTLDVLEFSLKPLSDNVFYGIHFRIEERGDLNVKVLTDRGRLIYDFESTDFEGVFEDRIDLAQEDSSYYFILQQNGKELIKKVNLR